VGVCVRCFYKVAAVLSARRAKWDASVASKKKELALERAVAVSRRGEQRRRLRS